MKKNLTVNIIIYLAFFVLALHSYMFLFNRKNVKMGESPSQPPQQMMSTQDSMSPRSVHMLAQGIIFLQNDRYMPIEDAQKRVLIRDLLRREELRKELKRNVEILMGALTEEQAQHIIKVQYGQSGSRFTPDPSVTISVERQAVQKTIETLKNDGKSL